ncbi:hypothetical protein ACFSYH_04960 [Populibacterium corticicola]|uniref:Uncharacterized protein n=1 Tax=Populibacterium corticicola TaxID=1812826 RepID=A0ABW5XFQ9_9MICO
MSQDDTGANSTPDNEVTPQQPEPTGEVDATDAETTDKPVGIPSNARKLIWAGAILVALYFIIDGIIGVVRGDADTSEAPTHNPTVTVTADAPTPTQDPVDRGEVTEFAAALPGTANQFALTSLTEVTDWPVEGALESYVLNYSGPAGDASVEVEVLAAQFKSVENAATAYDSRLAPDTTTISAGVVESDGTSVGDFVITVDETGGVLPPAHGDQTLPAGTARALWTNGTALFEAYAPADEIENFYNAYGL